MGAPSASFPPKTCRRMLGSGARTQRRSEGRPQRLRRHWSPAVACPRMLESGARMTKPSVTAAWLRLFLLEGRRADGRIPCVAPGKAGTQRRSWTQRNVAPKTLDPRFRGDDASVANRRDAARRAFGRDARASITHSCNRRVARRPRTLTRKSPSIPTLRVRPLSPLRGHVPCASAADVDSQFPADPHAKARGPSSGLRAVTSFRSSLGRSRSRRLASHRA